MFEYRRICNDSLKSVAEAILNKGNTLNAAITGEKNQGLTALTRKMEIPLSASHNEIELSRQLQTDLIQIPPKYETANLAFHPAYLKMVNRNTA